MLNITLEEFRRKEGLRVADIAMGIGCSIPAAYRYLKGTRIPKNSELIRRIHLFTNGCVDANSMNGLPPIINDSSKQSPATVKENRT